MLQFGELEDRMPENNPYDFERCLDDFVFLCFFVGNDFLPHLPSLNIRDGSIDQLLVLYGEVLPVVGDYLTKGGRINLKILEMFLEYLGRVEDDMFRHRVEKEEKDAKMQQDQREEVSAQLRLGRELGDAEGAKGPAVEAGSHQDQ